jgi:hypothetical protein
MEHAVSASPVSRPEMECLPAQRLHAVQGTSMRQNEVCEPDVAATEDEFLNSPGNDRLGFSSDRQSGPSQERNRPFPEEFH